MATTMVQKVTALPKEKKRKIMLLTLTFVLVFLAIAAMLYKRWSNVTLVVSDQKLCSDMMNKGFQVTGNSAQGGCRVAGVDVDTISALNPMSKKYKALQGQHAFDIEKNMVDVEH